MCVEAGKQLKQAGQGPLDPDQKTLVYRIIALLLNRLYFTELGRNESNTRSSVIAFRAVFLLLQHNSMAALFSDPFMEQQFSNRQNKTHPYQVQITHMHIQCALVKHHRSMHFHQR